MPKTAPRPAEPRPPAEPPRYHHGALRQALLVSAERLLQREGIAGLTLRAAAREAGVSHAAPKNHFGDIRGLLSDLAAEGFTRLHATAKAEVARQNGVMPELNAQGLGYVKFAAANPALFTLMFRSEQLDFSRPSLRDASAAAFGNYSNSAAPRAASQPLPEAPEPLTVEQAARIAHNWSFVHGFACLMLDGRLAPLLESTVEGMSALDLLTAILRTQ